MIEVGLLLIVAASESWPLIPLLIEMVSNPLMSVSVC